jgi:hypothetical protein
VFFDSTSFTVKIVATQGSNSDPILFKLLYLTSTVLLYDLKIVNVTNTGTIVLNCRICSIMEQKQIKNKRARMQCRIFLVFSIFVCSLYTNNSLN